MTVSSRVGSRMNDKLCVMIWIECDFIPHCSQPANRCKKSSWIQIRPEDGSVHLVNTHDQLPTPSVVNHKRLVCGSVYSTLGCQSSSSDGASGEAYSEEGTVVFESSAARRATFTSSRQKAKVSPFCLHIWQCCWPHSQVFGVTLNSNN